MAHKKTLKELRGEATLLKIKGRSKMDREQLMNAINRAKRCPGTFKSKLKDIMSVTQDLNSYRASISVASNDPTEAKTLRMLYELNSLVLDMVTSYHLSNIERKDLIKPVEKLIRQMKQRLGKGKC